MLIEEFFKRWLQRRRQTSLANENSHASTTTETTSQWRSFCAAPCGRARRGHRRMKATRCEHAGAMLKPCWNHAGVMLEASQARHIPRGLGYNFAINERGENTLAFQESMRELSLSVWSLRVLLVLFQAYFYFQILFSC